MLKSSAKNRKVYLVANKIDGLDPAEALADFYQLGFSGMFPTTATHGRGVRSMMEELLEPFPEYVEPDNSDSKGIKIGIVGRPNVGKSTLVNRLLGEDRVVVYDEAGTTRDSVYIDYERHGKNYTLIDTAGIRKRKNIKLAIEKFSIVKTLQAIEDANVVVLMVDAHEGLVEQDMHLMGSLSMLVAAWWWVSISGMAWRRKSVKRSKRISSAASLRRVCRCSLYLGTARHRGRQSL